MKLSGSLNLDGGELQNAKQQGYGALPTFTPGLDEGRLIFVSTGSDQGYWFGAEDGSASWTRGTFSTNTSEYSLVSQSINNGVTFTGTLVATDVAQMRAFLSEITLSSNLGSGSVLLEIFKDAARLVRVYANYIDLSVPTALRDNIVTYWETESVAGDMYISITNLTGSNGTFSLTVKVVGAFPIHVPPPPGDGTGVNAGVAGEGIIYNPISTQLDIDLDANPGLQLVGSGGAKKLSVKPAVGGGLATSGSGLAADATVVRTTGDQSIAGKKVFSGGTIALTPQSGSGPPVAGTYARGAFYIDTDDDVWYCLVGGTPGTWTFWGWKIRSITTGPTAGAYVGTILAGGQLNATISMKGRRGVLRRFNVWGADPAFAASNISVAFRVACYIDEGTEERDRIWTVSGTAKKTYMSAGASAGTNVLSVNSLAIAAPEDLLRIRKASTPVEEYGRIHTEGASWALYENLVNTLVANDNIMLVNEFRELPWLNTSAVPSNFEKLYLKFFNDDGVQSAIFGYDMYIESIGGGANL